MSKKKRDEFDYAAAFDSAMGEQFGEKFKTEWNILAGTWGGFVTVRENGKPLTRMMAEFGRGLSIGIALGREASP